MTASFHSVSFVLPDGRTLFHDLTFSIGPGRHGLIGPNGAGKTTLARMLAGELQPHSGVATLGEAALRVPQFEPPPEMSLGEYLLDVWALTAPRDVALRDEFLAELSLERRCDELSGGAWTKARLLRALTRSTGFMILDEPTNNLDASGRAAVRRFVEVSRGSGDTLLVISHDRELLEGMDSILELSNRGLASYGGGWAEYEELREVERAALERNLEVATREKAKAGREHAKQVEAQAKRQREAAKRAPKLGLPKILLGARKRRAEETAGKIDSRMREAASQAEKAAREAREELKFDPTIYAELPMAPLPASKLVAEAMDLNLGFGPEGGPMLWREALSFRLSGPARARISGPNGSGKTTLMERLLGRAGAARVTGHARLGDVSYAYLDQAYSGLAPELTVLEAFRARTGRLESEARGILARYLFQHEAVHQLAGSLSGGERMRLALACALHGEAAPQLLILDEPTNHLDLASTRYLEEALRGFPGALLVISHDERFVEAIGVAREIRLE